MKKEFYLVTETNGGMTWLFQTKEEANIFINWYAKRYYPHDELEADIEYEKISIETIQEAKERTKKELD